MVNTTSHYNFMKYRTLAFSVSCAIIVAFFGVAAYRYKTGKDVFNYSVDFTGGTQVLLKVTRADQADAQASLPDAVAIKNLLENEGWEGVVAREFSSSEEILVRVKQFSHDAKGLGEQMEQIIEKASLGCKVEILQSEGVGPGVGQALRSKSIMAVVLSLIAMLLYIALRFLSLGFAVGAVLALVHDALIVLACFMFFGREISINVIGAILAVLGYSINDTIVIYSSIRSNLKTMQGRSLVDIVNVSLNQTLRRTLLTSISTALAVGALFVLGGEGLRDFSLAFLVGIVVGTYSSIFIASPITMIFYRSSR